MKKNSCSPLKKYAALLVFPAVALFLWAFAEPKYVVSAPPVVVPDTSAVDARLSSSKTTAIKPGGMVVVNFSNGKKVVSAVIMDEELRKADVLQKELMAYAKKNKLSGELCKAFVFEKTNAKRDTCVFAAVGMVRGDALLIKETEELSKKMNILTLAEVEEENLRVFVPINQNDGTVYSSILITEESFANVKRDK